MNIQSIINKCKIYPTYMELVDHLTEDEKDWSLFNPVEFSAIIQKKYCMRKEADVPSV